MALVVWTVGGMIAGSPKLQWFAVVEAVCWSTAGCYFNLLLATDEEGVVDVAMVSCLGVSFLYF